MEEKKKNGEMMMKKITIFTLILGVGGIEKYISTLCKSLENSYLIEIICTYKVSSKPAFSFSDKIHIRYLISEKPDDVSLKKLMRRFQFFSVAKEIIRRIKFKYLERKLNIDSIKNIDTDYIITTRSFHNNLVSRYLNKDDIVTIATEHNYHQNDKKYIRRLVSSLSHFEYLIVPTKELQIFYSSLIPQIKCIHIANALDKEIKDKVFFTEDTKNFISVGRFSREKGFLDLIDVFNLIHKKNPKPKLFLLGDGYEKEKLQKKIHSLNLEKFVIMPGFVLPEEQDKYYKKCSVYLMSSITESFGLVLIEAMNYGIPCIAFDSAMGAKEIIRDDVGILIANRDKEKMANEALDLIYNDDKLKNYQQNINKYISCFSPTQFGKAWMEILKK